MIRLAAIDIDGTLIDTRSQVPEENRKAIERAIERGVQIILVTGRRYDFTQSIRAQLPAAVGMIVNNGALIKSSSGCTLLRRLLPGRVARSVIGATPHFRENAALVFDRPAANQIVFERIPWEDPLRRGYFERNREYLTEISPLEDALTEDPIQVMYTGAVGGMRRLVAELAALDFAADFSIATAEYEARNFTIVDVIERACSKASALAEWANRHGIQRDEIFAIGDNLNDREMLSFAGLAVVMANAVPELKTQGWPVTLSNDEAGVAAAIQRYILTDGNR